MIIIQSKLSEVLARPLKEGSHDPDGQMCVMEAIAYVAGEPWGDQPQCACPVISAFLRSWNDSLPNDAERDRLLKPLIAQLVDSKSTQAVEERRAFLALDWLIRVHTPKFLDLMPELAAHAKALRELEEIADLAAASAAGKLTAAAARGAAARDAEWAAARDAARDAAWAAAWAAARAAAWAAARDAAWDAAWAAARGAAARGAARDAARDAAWDATWAAARGAAARGAAAREFLKPTVEWLQLSALDLIDRMLAVQPQVAMGIAV